MDRCRENGCIACICEYFTTVVRVTGVVIAIVTWIIALNSIRPKEPWTPVYLIFVAVVLSILEGLFLFESCITRCCDNNGCCGKTWRVVLFLDNWRRSILYVALCIPCFFISDNWIVYLAGSALLLLAAMYLPLSLYPEPQEEPTIEQSGMDRDKYIFLNI